MAEHYLVLHAIIIWKGQAQVQCPCGADNAVQYNAPDTVEGAHSQNCTDCGRRLLIVKLSRWSRVRFWVSCLWVALAGAVRNALRRR